MDYETVAETFYEVLNHGQFADEALELLRKELQTTTELTNARRGKLVEAFTVLDGYPGNGEAIEAIWEVLSEVQGLESEMSRILAEVLDGKRPFHAY